MYHIRNVGDKINQKCIKSHKTEWSWQNTRNNENDIYCPPSMHFVFLKKDEDYKIHIGVASESMLRSECDHSNNASNSKIWVWRRKKKKYKKMHNTNDENYS